MKQAVLNNTEIRIEHALFGLMRGRDYRQIGVTDIAAKPQASAERLSTAISSARKK